jgi:NAD(P)-dependent dehydrogenase (short-subunit alcohol dehydrogenase family)
MSDLSGRTTVVVGASRGLGRGIARAFAEAGAAVIAVARGGQTEEAYLQQLGELLTPEMAGSALVDLVRADPATTALGYLLTAAGLQKLP